MQKADISFVQVEAPQYRQCAAGHNPPDHFIGRDGSDTGRPIRFFAVSGKGYKGEIFCEACLTVMNYIRHLKKKGIEFK